MPAAVADTATHAGARATPCSSTSTARCSSLRRRRSTFASTPRSPSLLPGLHGVLARRLRVGHRARAQRSRSALSGSALPAAGQHGCERRDADGRPAPARPGSRRRWRVCAELFSAFAAPPRGPAPRGQGVVAGVALPAWLRNSRRTCIATLKQAVDDLPDAALCLQPGKRLVGDPPRASRQGCRRSATSCRKSHFAGRRPVFVGDDHGDEQGFAVVQRLGGFGVKVGAGRTRALHRLPDVAAVRHWLNTLVVAEASRADDGR